MVEDRDELELRGHYVDLGVVGEDEKSVVLVGVGAVNDVLGLPLDGVAVEVELGLVEDDQGRDGDGDGAGDVEGLEGGVGKQTAPHDKINTKRTHKRNIVCSEG